MRKFKRRFYRSPSALWRDFRYVFQRRSLIKNAMGEDGLSPAFRERLMVMVTQVNGCRYCRYFHVNQAFKAGISEEEIRAVLEGSIPEETPSEECLALAYAQHWAEMNANPDQDYVEKMITEYGEEKFNQIDIVLRMIRVGNLLGNTFDFFLHVISFGRLGRDSSDD